MQLKFNVINYGVMGNAQDRRGGLIFAALCGVSYVYTIEHINWLPRVFIGSLLFFAGTGFVAENLWGSRHNLSRTEWFEVVVILSVFILSDQILNAVAVGLLVTTISFVVKYSKVSVIDGRPMRGGEIATLARRVPLVQKSIQHILSSWLLVVHLKGFIFFASSQSVTNFVRSMIDVEHQQWVPEYRRLRFVVFDCTLLDSLDASASKGFKKLMSDAHAAGVRIIWSHAPARTLETLMKRRIVRTDADWVSSLDGLVLDIEQMAIEYRAKQQAWWRKLHHNFALTQNVLNQRAQMEPFKQVFPMDWARVGCPWRYCTKMPIFRDKTILCEPGEVHGAIYLVHSGAVGLFAKIPQSEDEEWGVPKAVYRHGWFINRAMLLQAPSRFFAIAMEDGEVLRWSEEQWWHMASERPHMASSIQRSVMKQIVLDGEAGTRANPTPAEDSVTKDDSALLRTTSGVRRTITSSGLGSPTRRKTCAEGGEVPAQTEALPEEIQTSLQGLASARALATMSFYETAAAGEDTELPFLPKCVQLDLQIAFTTFAVQQKYHPFELVVPPEKVPKALMYAGVFDPVTVMRRFDQGVGENEFVRIGHEALAARLTKRQISIMEQIFASYDVDGSGTLELEELASVFREGLEPNISTEEVARIYSAWRDGESDSVTLRVFIAIMAMFIKRHEKDWQLLQAMQAVFDSQWCTDTSTVSYRELAERCPGLSETQAQELIWATDFRSKNGKGQVIDFKTILGAVNTCFDDSGGFLPPPPKLPRGRSSLGVERVAANRGRRQSVARGTLPGFKPVNTQDFVSQWRKNHTVGSGMALGEEDEEDEEPSEGKPEEDLRFIPRLTFRQQLYYLLEDPNSGSVARVLSVFLMVCNVLSVGILVAHPMIYHKQASPDYNKIEENFWYSCDASFTLLFSVELFLRYMVSNSVETPASTHFFLDPQNACDFVAVVSFYPELVARNSDTQEWRMLKVLRLARVARVGRLARLARHVQWAMPVIVVFTVIWFIYLKHVELE